MPSIDLLQQLIYTLALSLFLVYLTRLPKRSLFLSSLLFILLTMGVNFIPLLRGSSLVEIMRGVVGDVSTASGVLLTLIILNQFDFSENRSSVLNLPEKVLLIIIGVLLYLSTFGFSALDIYAYGYLSLWMVSLVVLGSLILIIFDRRLGFVLLFALIAFYLRLQSSNNLWDYLFDPVLWLVLLIDLLMSIFNRSGNSRATNWRQY